jgi:NADH-quinone oxidoreductase subunit A
MSLSAYVPIIALFALAALFALFSVGVSQLVGPKRPNRAKLEAYECGIEAFTRADWRWAVPGPVLPDRDALHHLRHRDHLPVPWAVTFNALGLFGFVEMILFIGTVLIAYAYVWRRGGLDWD